MAESRTFKLTSPHMSGTDVRAWQQFLVDRFRKWDIDYELAIDGDYGQATRAATASFMRAWGVASAADAPRNGDSAPHSTAPVTSVLNGDAQALDNVTVPAEAAVPVIGSKVGPYQGGNENAAPQADGDLLPINNG